MINSILLYVIAFLLLLVSILDLKFKQVPSILLTGMLFVVVAINPENLILGLLAGILALMMYESDYFGGIGDVKVMATLGMMVSNYYFLFLSIILVFIFGISWKIFYRWRIKKDELVAFIPVFLFVYLTIWYLGGFA